MNKIQKFSNFLKSEAGFFVAIAILIIGLFCLLSPRISSQLFSFKRQAILNQFINDVRLKQGIDSQEYWKFREFYSPGYFIFSRTGTDKSSIEKANKTIGIKYDEKNITLVFLVFSSPRINSLDMLTKQTNLNSITSQEQLLKNHIIFKNENSIIYQESPKTIKIVFLLNNEEMKGANGFFDYQDKDKKITQGMNWFNVTSVKID